MPDTHRYLPQNRELTGWSLALVVGLVGGLTAGVVSIIYFGFMIARALLVAAGVLSILLLVDGRPAFAQAQPPVNIAQALTMLVALRSLDGRTVVVKQNGVDVPVVVPWEFNSGALRLRIARNISTLAVVEKLADEARQAIIREIVKEMPLDPEGRPPTSLPPGTPEMERFLRLWAQALDEPAKGSSDLARIKSADLRLDKNEIPVTVLSALVPILDE